MPPKPPTTATYRLGELDASEQLIRDLYLELRRRTRMWANITFQTAQARMGYIGQHLVSVVTGYPGGRSGARGYDLLRPDGTHGEIKTCYRVDQLGKCKSCAQGVAPDEKACSTCGSTDLIRKEDSKWLISLRNEQEFADLLEPTMYYLVLFEFTDLDKPDTIRASIWTVSPSAPGFLLCMVDYYLNIRAASDSKAPFNLWPYRFKFELMRPMLIYQALINPDDSIVTQVFPKTTGPVPHRISPLESHARAKVPAAVWVDVAEHLGAPRGLAPVAARSFIEKVRRDNGVSDDDLCDHLARAFYRPLVTPHLDAVPAQLKKAVAAALP